MVRPIEVRPVGRYRIWLRYQDGTEGEVDLPTWLVEGCSPLGTMKACSPRSSLARMAQSNGRATWTFAQMPCTSASRVSGQKKCSQGPKVQMPEVSRFYGLVIKIFYDDHNPPHFHVEYGEYEVLVSINTLAIMSGRLPARALGMATEWASLRSVRRGKRTSDVEVSNVSAHGL